VECARKGADEDEKRDLQLRRLVTVVFNNCVMGIGQSFIVSFVSCPETGSTNNNSVRAILSRFIGAASFSNCFSQIWS